MRLWPILLTLATAGCDDAGSAIPGRSAHPLRVMSMNQCTDQLVLALLPPDRIASVTWLSRDPRFSAEVAAARRVPVNRGTAEEVVRARTDLIVTDTFSNPAGRALLRRLGYPMIEVADAATVADIRRNVRIVAAALDERPRGEALIAHMDAVLAARDGTQPRWRVAAWDRDGMGSGPMLGIALAAAGLRDVGAAHGDAEALLVTAPDLLVDRDEASADPSLGDDRARQPLIRRRWGPDRRLHVDQASLFCASPAIARAVTSLRTQVKARLRRLSAA